MPLQPGLSSKAVRTVSDSDTAVALGTGDVPVLATPRLITYLEQAAVVAVVEKLAEGETTVGSRVQVDHVAPVAVGSWVVVEATLDKVEGRRLTFRVNATDERGLVAAGKVTRVLVDRERFLDKLA